MADSTGIRWAETLYVQLKLREEETRKQKANALVASRNLDARARGEMDGESPFLGRNDGVAKRLHAIGNGNPPCVIRELTRGLK